MKLMLEDLLDDKTSTAFRAFSVYLQQQYAIENLMFWLDVQRYRHDYMTATIGNDNNSTTEESINKTLAQQCMTIVSTYIQFHSCQEINIPYDMRQSILNKVLLADVWRDYHPDLFVPASEAVLELMRSNSFLPWLGQWAPSMLPTPPLSSFSNQQTFHKASSSISSLVSSLSCPDGWHICSSSSRLSISSFRSTNDTMLTYPSAQQHHRRIGGLSYPTMLKRMKAYFLNSRTRYHIGRSSLTWPSTSYRKS